jgi:hypothetical protein
MPGTINHRDFYIPLRFIEHETMGLRWLRKRMDGEVHGMDLNLDPEYQRDHVWTDKQAEAFVGHFIEGGAVPAVVINTDSRHKRDDEVVDGKQRVTALYRWVKGEIAACVTDGRRIMWAELDEETQNYLDGPSGPRIDIGYVALERVDVLRLYLRLNRGGTVHTDTEINRVRGLLAEEIA